MNKMEYASEIARKVNGEVREVKKVNGVTLTGITIRNETNISPTIYIDEMYLKDMDIDEAAEKVKSISELHKVKGCDLSLIMEFEKAKPMLRARLLNEMNAENFEVYRQAPEPFENLIIVPYIDGVIENGSTRVTEGIMKAWKISADEVIDIAEENSSKDIEIKSMQELLSEMMGIDVPELEEATEMIVISNKSKCFGAYSIIPAMPKLKAMFPNNGYIVLPSSVHEVIVVGNNPDHEKDEFDTMVNDVNTTQLAQEDILSSIAYVIK